MTSYRKLICCMLFGFVLCGCERQQTPVMHVKPVEAVERAVEKFSRGGEGWGWVQFVEIKREVLAITNVGARAQAVLASAELIASMNLLDLPQRERISVTREYWNLTSQFYDLLVMDKIDDKQRLKYLVTYLRKYRALSFSLPLCAQRSNESDKDFMERKIWAKDLYANYDAFASRWHRIYRPNLLKSIPSVGEHDFDKKTRFVCDYPSKELFFKSPIFSDELSSKSKGGDVKSPLLYGRRPLFSEHNLQPAK